MISKKVAKTVLNNCLKTGADFAEIFSVTDFSSAAKQGSIPVHKITIDKNTVKSFFTLSPPSKILLTLY